VTETTLRGGYRFIHGGAWRDPAVDSLSFEPAVKELWKSSSKFAIAGFASINYRLSPYPSHAEDPSSPDDRSRNAHYPDHLIDVAQGLLYMEEHYHIGDRYLLAGHSAGGTLAFELNDWYMPRAMLPVPAAVIGIAGIYNFEAFIEDHSEIPAYRELIENAFPDKRLWERASPYKNRLPNYAAWEQAKAIIISHSKEDELVEEAQSSYMLERARMAPHCKDKVHFLEASGKHDEIWSSGTILAGLITKSIEILLSSTN
jgi:kynurenine formamidase